MNGAARASRDARARLGLGTVQFGMPYGPDHDRRVPPEQIPAILESARREGLDTLDTAAAYGESEALLGRAGVEGWRVVTKLPPLPAGRDDPQGWVREQVAGSLERLGVASVHGVLLHRPADLLAPKGEALYAGLRACREEGLIREIGLSVYAPQELEAIVHRYPVGLVQAPFNVFDRRLEASGWLERLKHAGVEIHVRSVFLQGLLLAPDGGRPARFERWNPAWRTWHAWLRESGAAALEACLRFALARAGLDRVIVGVDNLQQLDDILASATCTGPVPPDSLECDDLDLIDPSRWKAA